MLQQARTALVAILVLSASSASALADNDHNYIKYRSDKSHGLRTDVRQQTFNPYDYDVAHMTSEDRLAYNQKRIQNHQRAIERLSAANVNGNY